jgi:peptidoglycan/LPS O-acetylase OafA/YrhL
MQTARRERTLGHVPALDGVRGLAVLIVVINHIDTTLPRGTPLNAVYRASKAGFLGVDVFFVLSGFLITGLLLTEGRRHGHVRIIAFYARRALRLLPALYVFLLAQSIYASVANLHPGNQRSSLLWALLYVSNWQTSWHLLSVSEGMGHLWSLAVEEQFYLVWPGLLLLLLRLDRSRRVLTGALLGGIACVAVHRALRWTAGSNWLFEIVRTDTRADSLLIGALAAVVWQQGGTATWPHLPRAATIAAVLAAGIVMVSRSGQAWLYLGGYTLLAALVAVVVLALVDTDWAGRRLFELPSLQLLGRVSYGLYLWHLLAFLGVGRWVDPSVPAVPRLLLAVGLAAMATALSWRFVERPALRLKRRFTAITGP